jgi:hypothetical protein
LLRPIYCTIFCAVDEFHQSFIQVTTDVFGFTSGRNSLNFRYNYYVRECVKMHVRAFVFSKIFRGYTPDPVKKGKGRDELGKRGVVGEEGWEGKGRRGRGIERGGEKEEEKEKERVGGEEGKLGKDCMDPSSANS